MSYFKIHVNDPRMKPWMVERVFGRKLWPGYHTNWDDIVKKKEWITYNSEANGTAFNCVSNRNGKSGYGKSLTHEVVRLFGTPAPVPKYTDKQVQMSKDYVHTTRWLAETMREFRSKKMLHHKLSVELENQLGMDWEIIIKEVLKENG